MRPHQSTSDTSNETMFSVAPRPIFSGFGDNSPGWNHRPTASSPLSSSPIRANGPRSPNGDSTFDLGNLRQSQSSPISGPPPKFKYASRPTRPNPRVRRHEEAQESRRKLFLQNVRQRADDKSFQRRDMEGTLLKSSWDREMRERALAKRVEGDAFFCEADIDDAAEMPTMQEEQAFGIGHGPSETFEEMMVDEMAEQEQDELNALLTMYNQTGPQQAETSHRPESPAFSDDEEYDAIVMELMPSFDGLQGQGSPSQEMDMS